MRALLVEILHEIRHGTGEILTPDQQLVCVRVLVATNLFSGLLYLLIGLPVIGVSTVMFAGLLVVLLRQRSRLRHILMLSGILYGAVFGLMSGGLHGPVMIWLPVVPVVGFLLGGARLAWQYAWGWVALPLLWWLTLSPPSDGGVLGDRHTNVLLFTVFIASLATTCLLTVQSASRSRDKRRLEEEVRVRRAAEEEARAAREAQGRFLAVMSHEIRTPLNGVLGLAELLGDTTLSDKQQHYVATMERSGRGLLEIVNNVLDYAKSDADRLELELARVDVSALIHDSIALFAGRAHTRRVTLRAEKDAQCPGHVISDPGRLRQIVLNLVGNAVKFTADGQVIVRAGWSAASEPRLHIRVEDEGPGIVPEALEAIFEPFRQASSSTTRTHGGTGLGLAISRRLAEAMGGSLTVDSVVGRGSVFTLTVPAHTAAAPSAAVPRPGAGLVGRVLVVDDHPVNLMVARGLCERLGLQVDTASDGAAAIASVQERVPDVVLMDCYMPVMDGFAATRAIKARCDVPIIGLSASVSAEDVARGRAAGMNDYIGKPVDVLALEEIIARYCPASSVAS